MLIALIEMMHVTTKNIKLTPAVTRKMKVHGERGRDRRQECKRTFKRGDE